MLQCTSQTDGLRLLSDRMSQDIRRSIYAVSNLSLLQRTHLTVWCSQWHNIFFTPTSLSCKLLSNASTSCTFLHWLGYITSHLLVVSPMDRQCRIYGGFY